MFKKILKILFGKKSLAQKERICKLHSDIWQREKILLEKEQEIEEEKYKLKKRSWDLKLPSFSKLLLIFLFINFTILEIFTGWVTVNTFSLAYTIGVMPDFMPLITLLGAVIGQTISYGIYASKSKAENVIGGITYEMALKNFDNSAEG